MDNQPTATEGLPQEDKEQLDLITPEKPKLQLIRGGRDGDFDPPMPPSKTWLHDMEPGTTFFAKDQGAPHPLVEEYTLQEFTPSKNTAKLLIDLGEHGNKTIWVDTEDFEKRFKLRDILRKPEVFDDQG